MPSLLCALINQKQLCNYTWFSFFLFFFLFKAVLTTPPPQCKLFELPEGGNIVVPGNHGGDTVPVSVTVTFICDTGFFLKQLDNQLIEDSTCQHDGNSNNAIWSIDSHPGCGSCPSNCEDCTDADTCLRCNSNYILSDSKTCIRFPGLSKEDPVCAYIFLLFLWLPIFFIHQNCFSFFFLVQRAVW